MEFLPKFRTLEKKEEQRTKSTACISCMNPCASCHSILNYIANLSNNVPVISSYISYKEEEERKIGRALLEPVHF
jgi:hypothetical protein